MSISPKGQLDFLLADTYHHETSWRWGSVTSVRPLSVRLDGDTGSNRIYPIDLTGGRFPNGSRILVALYGTQAYAIGPLPPLVGEWKPLSPTNGWGLLSSQPLAYRHTPAGIQLRGTATANNVIQSDIGTTAAAITRLPSDSRPTYDFTALVVTNPLNRFNRIRINTGYIYLAHAETGAYNWVSLYNILIPFD